MPVPRLEGAAAMHLPLHRGEPGPAERRPDAPHLPAHQVDPHIQHLQTEFQIEVIFEYLSRKGVSWCATRVSVAGRVRGTSQQSRDVECGELRNRADKLYCPAAGTTTARTATTNRTTTRTTRKTTSVPSRKPARPPPISSSAPGVTTEAELRQFSEAILAVDEDSATGQLQVGSRLCMYSDLLHCTAR